MSGTDFLALCRRVCERMGEHRFRHSAGVARMAEKLARRHGASPLKARVAGILHDVARLWKGEDLLSYAQREGLFVSDTARQAPVLLHAPIGAHIARTEFAVDDPEVLGAITHHTVAGPGMTLLEKILYMADTFEPSRTFEGRASLETLAFASLDEGFLACVRESMRYLDARGTAVAPETRALYESLVSRHAGTP